ncbi:MAG: DEAD/DEAH box helicase, partial [Victivallales bacterium]|nr:DEAD/DEAH box helicase [Victivallales bacterium]
MSYPDNYPKTQPAWLSLMPPCDQIGSIYARAIPALAEQTMMRHKASITWDDTFLRLVIGKHTLERRVTGGRLVTHCTCGYQKDGHCIHEYLSYTIMRYICRKEKWTYPGESGKLVTLEAPKKPVQAVTLPPPGSRLASLSAAKPAAPQPSVSVQQPPAAPAATPEPATPVQESGSSLFATLSGASGSQLVKLSPSARSAPAVTLPPPSRPKPEKPEKSEKPEKNKKENAQNTGKKQGEAAAKQEKEAGNTLASGLLGNGKLIPMFLTVEADFHLEGRNVGLRFYCSHRKDEGGVRQLMTLESILNRARQLKKSRKSKAARVYDIPHEDEEFLIFVLPFLSRLKQNQLRGQVLSVPEKIFQEWRREFAANVGRFINRDDQRPLPPPNQSVPMALAFQLSDGDAPPEMFRIQAQCIFPDGTRKYFWELLKETEDDPTMQITRNEIFSSPMPVPWSILGKYFSRPMSTLRKDRAAELLPQLLNYHLELLESGPCVLRSNGKQGKSGGEPKIHFSLKDNYFVIQCIAGGHALPVNANRNNLTKNIRLDGKGRIVIEMAAVTEETATVMSIIHELARNPNATTSVDSVNFVSSLNTATFLAQAWKAIPIEIRKSADKELETLFPADRQSVDLIPHLMLNDRDSFVSFAVEWKDPEGKYKVAPNTLNEMLRERSSVIRDESGRWLAIDPNRAETLRQELIDQGIITRDGLGGTSLLRSAARESIRRVTAAIGTSKIPTTDAESATFAQRLITEPQPELPPIPPHLDKMLRDYQRVGVNFLLDRSLCRAGVILADDMGLGKTIQILSMLETWRQAKLAEKSGNRFSVLVVCPATVIGVWIEQAKRFCPDLPVAAMVGTAANRQNVFREHEEGVIVTHYGLMRSDIELLQGRRYEFVILDEAQTIKNPQAQATVAVKTLDAAHRLALTGTPLENRLTDLWSIMDFLNKGFLGEMTDFNYFYTGSNRPSRVKKLAPLMLRRDKSTVARELPQRTVNIQYVEFTPEQRDLYDRDLVKARSSIKSSGAIEILAALTRLRQICCDPELYLKEEHNAGSGKMAVLLDKLEEL